MDDFVQRVTARTRDRILATPDRKLSPAEHMLLDAYYAENPLVVAYARAGLH